MEALGALFIAMLAAQQQTPAAPDDFQEHFNKALALSQEHKDDEAIAEYRRTLELKPGLFEANANLGILLLRNKRPQDALAFLKAAAEAKPNDQRTSFYYADALLATGDLEEARRRYSADPQSPAAKSGLLNVAAALERAGKTSEAVAIYKLYPDDPAVHTRAAELEKVDHLALADKYREDKDTAKMLEQLRLAVVSDPKNFDTRMSLGRALRDNRQLLPAAEQFFAATKLKPDAAEAWNELASALIVSEKYAEGLAALDHVRALHKEIPGDFFLRAITLDKLQQRPQALEAYRQFLDADGNAHPDQEFQARQRMRIIEKELRK